MKGIFKKVLGKLFWGLFRHLLSDRRYAQVRYWLEIDRLPDLQNPETFTAKIQWIKLNERTELRKKMANRLAAREYATAKIGEEHLVPLHGIFEELTAEAWQSLPDRFVLKANHGCEMLHIVSDKRNEVFKDIYKKTRQWQQEDYYYIGREWAYKGLPRTILAEQLLLDADGSIPKDYKFFCFNGTVKLIQVDFDRFGEQKRNIYDREFRQIDTKLLYPNYEGEVTRPPKLTKAIELAETLTKEVSFLRVDLYLLNEHIYVGELTNYPGNGFVPFQPQKMERKVGSWLDLESGNRNYN